MSNSWSSRPWSLISAPSNLGLRPPQPGSVPGTRKAPEALREAGLHDGLKIPDLGVVLPPRYVDDLDPAVPRLRNQDAIVEHARRLSGRLDAVLAGGGRPLVLGGDCSLLVAAGVACKRRGRYGLVHVDGHTDFRHPGNSEAFGPLAGESQAAANGLHWPAVSAIDGLAPYFRPGDAVHIGCRDYDESLEEAASLIGQVVPASQVDAATPGKALDVVGGLDGYWVHLDVDVLDPGVMPAVDTPDPGGLDVTSCADLLLPLVRGAAGFQVCVLDPDLDPDGEYARVVSDLVVGLLRS